MTKWRCQKEWFCYEKQYAHLEIGSKAMRAEGKKNVEWSIFEEDKT